MRTGIQIRQAHPDEVDGVMTDGKIVLDNHGIETRNFHVRDGLAWMPTDKKSLTISPYADSCVHTIGVSFRLYTTLVRV